MDSNAVRGHTAQAPRPRSERHLRRWGAWRRGHASRPRSSRRCA